MTSPFMNVKQLAEFLGISRRTIYNLVANNKIPYRRAGDTLLFHKDEIDEWTKRARLKAVA
jgi:excisionase family DNA binding protein